MKQAKRVLKILENAVAFEVEGMIVDNFELADHEAIQEALDEDENPIVLSIYNYEQDKDYYFDYSDIEEAKIEKDVLLLRGEHNEVHQIKPLMRLVA